MDIRNDKAFSDVFLKDPEVLGVDSIAGSQVVYPVVFKTQATKQYGPIREFRRRVRIALEENAMLPGDPNRVFNTFVETERVQGRHANEEAAAAPDPTTLKVHEGNPFGGE